MPWHLLANANVYMTWLLGYSALLGPIGGVMIADYFIVRRQRLDAEELYRADGVYRFQAGFSVRALVALALGILPHLPGFLAKVGVVPEAAVPAFWRGLFDFSWFSGFGIAFLVHLLLNSRKSP
jgi:NCS1 family nucleobase:cation symporter-1